MSSSSSSSSDEPAAGLQGPLVRLVDATRMPYDLSVASARTCYSAKGIVYPEDVSATEKSRAVRDRIAASTLAAGHLTTRQHPHFIFAIDRISRHLVWSFLHAHPFYNSEQVSQRYVEVKREQLYIPPSLLEKGRQNSFKIYRQTMDLAMDAYFRLIELLEPVAAEEFFKVFPARRKKEDQYRGQIHKKAMEAARYVLPVSTLTYLYHTINGLTLHRYRRLCTGFDVPTETKALVDAMWQAVSDIDPMYAGEMADPVPIEETVEYAFFKEKYGNDWQNHSVNSRQIEKAREFIHEFDEHLQGRSSRLLGYNAHAEETLAASARAVLGLPVSELSNEAAMDLLLNPAKNHHLGSTLNETTVSKLTRSLYNVQYTFARKVSHTADSQDQRHRAVPGSRPLLMQHFSGQPDYIVPLLIEQCEPALEYYRETMTKIFNGINAFIDSCHLSEHKAAEGSVSAAEEAVYMLPNAFPVRYYESGDLLNLHHKWKARTCYNAQEEIFRASVEELIQVKEVHSHIGRYIAAPCYLRYLARETPFCPEGSHYCGVPVWKLNIEQYERIL